VEDHVRGHAAGAGGLEPPTPQTIKRLHRHIGVLDRSGLGWQRERRGGALRHRAPAGGGELYYRVFARALTGETASYQLREELPDPILFPPIQCSVEGQLL